MASSDEPSYEVLYSASYSLAATTFVSGISFGVMTSLYSVCVYNFICKLRSKNVTKRTTLLTTWITIMWMLSSISTVANAYCSVYAYSWKMNYPGGPIAYLADTWNKPVPVLAYTTYVLTIWFADALMLWRLVVFYHGVHSLVRGIIFPFMSLMYIGVIGTGCFMTAILLSNQTLYSKYSMKAAIPFFALSVALNVFATALISIRLLLFKKYTEKTLGHKDAQVSPYTSIAAMLIESSSLYALWSLVFIIVYAVDNPAQYVMLMTLCNVQVIAPVLIVYRVSKGIAWERTTSAKLTSTLLFSTSAAVSDYEPVELVSIVPKGFAGQSQVESMRSSTAKDTLLLSGM